MMENGLVQPNT